MRRRSCPSCGIQFLFCLQEKGRGRSNSESESTAEAGRETKTEGSHDVSQAGGRQGIDEDCPRRTKIDKSSTTVGKHTIAGRTVRQDKGTDNP